MRHARYDDRHFSRTLETQHVRILENVSMLFNDSLPLRARQVRKGGYAHKLQLPVLLAECLVR